MGSSVPMMNESRHEWINIFVDSFTVGTLEPTNDQLPTSVASYMQLNWLEHCTAIMRLQVQTPLKS